MKGEAMPRTCTVRNAVTGACGKEAVRTFQSRLTGETLAECAEHDSRGTALDPMQESSATGPRVGDAVTVRRHGKTYDARVSRVGKRGAVYAVVTYGNGATREVRLDR